MEKYNLGHVPNLSERIQKLNTPISQALSPELGFTWVANNTLNFTISCQKQKDIWFEMRVNMANNINLSNEMGGTINYNYMGVAMDNPATDFTIFPYHLGTVGIYDYVILATSFTILCMKKGEMVEAYYNFTPLYFPDGETMMAYANTYEPIEI